MTDKYPDSLANCQVAGSFRADPADSPVSRADLSLEADPDFQVADFLEADPGFLVVDLEGSLVFPAADLEAAKAQHRPARRQPSPRHSLRSRHLLLTQAPSEAASSVIRTSG